MMLPLFVAMVLAAHPAPISCGANKNADTDAWRNGVGVSVSLGMQSGDDHTKLLHWCESQFELRITRADGSIAETGWDNGNDAPWDRSIEFRVEGFSADFQHAVALVREGGSDPMVEVLVYELADEARGRHASYVLGRRFDTPCAATLRVTGMTAGGHVVVATKAGGVCGKGTTWEITGRVDTKGNSVVRVLPVRAVVTPLQPGVNVGSGGH